MKKRIIGCLLITSIILSGCSFWKPKNTEDDRKPMEQNSAEFDWGNYQKAIYQNRTLIKECNANYQKDISTIKQKENKMLDFSNCKFEPIDEVKSVSLLQEQILDVTPEQSVNTIKQWLKEIHQIIGRQWLIIIRILRREVVFLLIPINAIYRWAQGFIR